MRHGTLWRTFDTSRRGILQRIDGHGYRVGTRRRIGNRSDFGRALAEIGPFVGLSVTEAVSHCAIGTVDHACAPRMLDTGDGFFIL